MSDRSNLFRNRNYMMLFVGQVLSLIGTNVYSFALLWDIKIMTQNAFLMSLIGLGWALPQVVLGPFAGVLVDRVNKRWIMQLSDLLRFCFVFTVTILSYLHVLTPLEMIVAVFLSNTVATVFNPAAGALTPLMVPAEQLPTANGLEQAGNPLAAILGPAISAGLIAWIGVTGSFALNTLTFLISVLTLMAIRVQEPAKVKRPLNAHHVSSEMKEGFQAIRGIRLVMVLFPVAFLINFIFAPVDLYLVQFVTLILHKSQVAVGEINVSFALGMLLGALSSNVVGRLMRAGYVLGGGLLIATAAVLGLPLIPWLPADLVFMLIVGIGVGLHNVTIFTILQQMIAKEVMGRVFALLGTLFGAAMPLGLLVGGVLARIFNIRIILTVAGVGGILLAVILLSLPAIRASKPLIARVEGVVSEA